MGENISTIPINDIFEPKSGCPFCRAYSILEERSIEYILGGAMMQPEIRIKTNELGFCKTHYKKMIVTGNRLQNALLLQSHLKHISQSVLNSAGEHKKPEKRKLAVLNKVNNECYLCNRIDFSILHFMKTTIAMWQKDETFKKLLLQQEYFCMPHYEMLVSIARGNLTKKQTQLFRNEISVLCNNYLEIQREKIDEFCAMFDYRNSGKAKVSPDCIEDSISFLCGDFD